MPHGAKKYEGEQITMLTFDDSYFLGETRDGFYIEPMMKMCLGSTIRGYVCHKTDL